jgi:hypothetical protein
VEEIAGPGIEPGPLGGSTLDEANRYLWDVFEPEWKSKFAKKPAYLGDHSTLRRQGFSHAEFLACAETSASSRALMQSSGIPLVLPPQL